MHSPHTCSTVRLSNVQPVRAARIIVLFLLAVVAEIGGAWLIWQAVREHRLWWLAAGGILALAAYGFVATAQPDAHFGRVLAAYGGVFVAGSLAWGVLLDGFKPTRWDLTGAAICLLGVGIIMLTPKH
jgi:small multidrug resistance family-3 protein